MSKIFLSHSSHDNASALAVASWLTDHGWSDYFLDVSADRGLAPGERWQEALKRANERCQVVIFLISESWLRSRWCQAEFLLAKQLGKAIFGVLLEPLTLDALPPEMRDEWQLCDLANGLDRQVFRVEMDPIVPATDISFSKAGLARLKTGLDRAGLDSSTFPWPPPSAPDRPPYAGLRALDREDAAIFFGRDASITLALDTLRRLRDSSARGLFVVLGASGAGKSSFLRAGLLPRLARDDRHFVVTPVIRPERAAMTGPNGLIASLEAALRALDISVDRAVVRKRVRDAEGFMQLLAELQAAAHRRIAVDASTPPPALLFAIDQAEELFGVEHRQEAEDLLSLLGAATAADVPGTPRVQVFVLVAIRSDSYERLQVEPRLERAAVQVFSLPPIPREEYKAIIEGPAERHRDAGFPLRVDPLLTERLLQDAQGADALPLLAFTLERLLVEHGGDGLLSQQDYDELGGIEGSIEAAVAAASIDPHLPPVIPADEGERHRLLRRAFIPWLARVDPETEERKRRVATWDEIPVESQQLLERLIQQRLLIRDRRRLPGSPVDSVVVEVSHEALLRRWPLLTRWLDQDAEALKAIDATKRAASEWVKNGHRESWLVHKSERLSLIEALLERAELDRLLGEDGRLYVRACRKRDDEQAAEATRAERERIERERHLQEAQQEAERERLRVAESEAKAAKERAAAARRISHRTMIGAAVAVLLMAVALWMAYRTYLQQRAAEHSLGALSVAEASRRHAAGFMAESVAHLARAVRLDPSDPVWRASLVQALITNRWSRVTADIRTGDVPQSVVFSPDGRFLLVAAGDAATLWDTATPNAVKRYRRFPHKNIVTDARFSPDGRFVATTSRDRTVRVWDVASGQPRGEPIRLKASMHRVRFARDGKHLIVSDVRALMRVTIDGKDDRTGNAPNPTGMLAQSPSGRFAVISSNRTLRLQDLDSGQWLGPTLTGTSYYDSVTFSRDESFVAIRSENVLHVLSTASGAYAFQPAQSPLNVSFGEDARHLLFWGENLFVVASLPNQDAANPTYQRIELKDRLRDASLREHGTRVITRSTDAAGTAIARLWNVQTGQPIASMPADGAIAPVVCGDVVLVVNGSNARLWNVVSGAPVGDWMAHPATIERARFNSNCSLAVTTAGTEARLIDASTGSQVTQPLVHAAAVTDVVFNAKEDAIVTESAVGVRVWDLTTGAASGDRLLHGEKEPTIAAVSRNGARMVTASETHVRVWNTATGALVGSPIAFEQAYELEMDDTGDRVFVIGLGGEKRLFEVPSGKQLGRTWTSGERYYDGVEAVIAPDWTQVITFSNKAARIWNIGPGGSEGALLTHRRPINSVTFSRDGRKIVTTSADATARIWSRDGKPIGEILRHEQSVGSAVFSANGERVVTLFDELISERGFSAGHPRNLRVWDATTGAAVGGIIRLQEDVTAFAISPDGRRVLTGTEGDVRLWDCQSGSRIREPLAIPDDATVSHATFSSDGKRLVIVAGTSTYFYDAEQLTPIGSPIRVPGPGRVLDVRFLPGDDRLLIVSARPKPPDPKQGTDSGMFATGYEPTCENTYDQCVKTAMIWDIPTGSAEDASLLARVAEVVSGYRINDLGVLELVDNRAQLGAALRQELEEDAASPSRGQQIARWLLAAARARAASPYARPDSAPVQRAEAAGRGKESR